MKQPPRRVKPPVIVVRPLSNSADDLKAAVQMAHEWGERPFDESKAMENLPARGDSEIALLALRNNQAAGMLRGMIVHLWNESEPCAFAPLVWTRGVCENGGQVPSESREWAALSLVRELPQWARERKLGKVRALFRAGMTPDPKALAAMGMRREFRVFIRRFPLPGDPVSGRVRWFSTERREAKGEEMNLPLEKMFPELFADSRRPPPPTRRLRMSDWETVRASHLARKSAFSESDFYGLFRRAVSRPDYCALATADEAGRVCGVLIGSAAAHPFADGRVSRVMLLEWDAAGARAARRTVWGLWRGFVFWSARSLSRAALVVPPEGRFGDEFVRRCRLTPFGVCWLAPVGESTPGPEPVGG